MQNVIIAITIPMIPRCARVVRSSALAIREMPYVDAARACGFGHARIILRHMVPNVMAPYLIMLTAFVGQAILVEASLSFLGLGVQEPTPAWGLMLQGGAEEYAESGAVDGDLSRASPSPGRVRLQPVRRFAARRLDPKLRDGDLRPAQRLAQSAERVERRREAAERRGLDHRLDHLGAAQPHVERRLAELLHLASSFSAVKAATATSARRRRSRPGRNQISP